MSDNRRQDQDFTAPPVRRRGRHASWRALVVAALACVAVVLILWFTLTSPAPLADAGRAPTAADVSAGRSAYLQLRAARGNPAGTRVQVGSPHLAGLSALATHGFRPDRLQLAIQGSELRAVASHPLPFGRWLNLTLRFEGPSSGFPRSHLKIGAWSLPPFLSRVALESARWILHLRHTDVPPLDRMVRDFSIANGQVRALVSMPGKSGVIDQVAGAVALPIDAQSVIRIYCALAGRQRREPTLDFAEQVRRAFSVDPQGVPRANLNRSAFIALGMLLVDERVGDFAHISQTDIRGCRIAPVPVRIYDRWDWPKHWTLSAALAVGAGTQLSEAAGEWKELADSLPRGATFAVGDPSGFSMADLAADRAGFKAAQAAGRADRAEELAAKLARVTAQQLLPRETIEREDGLANAQFVARYGSIEDPRFRARLAQIDSALDRSGLR